MTLMIASSAIGQNDLKVTVKLLLPDSFSRSPIAVVVRNAVGRITYFKLWDHASQFTFLLPQPSPSDCLEVGSEEWSGVPGKVCFGEILKDSVSISFRLVRKIPELPNVTVRSSIPLVVLKGDTVEYTVPRNPDPEVRKLRDVLRHLPGFTVDDHGRILYHGKEITSILIDGEDLSGNDYKSLSDNLSAESVERVQVLNDYNSNRILKLFDKSGEIALNVLTPADKKGRVSSNLLIGVSTRGKVQAEAGFSFLGERWRSILSGKMNNTGNNPVIDESESVSQRGESANSYGAFIYRPILSTRRAVFPIGRPGYVGPGSTADVKFTNGLDLERGRRLRATIGLEKNDVQLESDQMSSVLLPDQAQWTIMNHEKLKTSGRTASYNLEISQDRMGSSIYSLSLYARHIGTGHEIDNILSGRVVDSSNDRLGVTVASAGLLWNATYLLNPNKVLQWKTDAFVVSDEGDQFLHTTRTGVFYGYPPSKTKTRQVTSAHEYSGKSSISVLTKRKRSENMLGFVIAAVRRPIEMKFRSRFDTALVDYINYDRSLGHYRRQSMNGRFASVHHLSDLWEASLTINGGIAAQSDRSGLAIRPTSGVLVAFQRKVSAFKSFQFSVGQESEPASFNDYFEGPLLVGAGNLIYGQQATLFTTGNRSISFSFINANIFRGQHLFVSGSYQSTESDNVPSQTIYPEYSVLRYGNDGKSGMINLYINLSKSILPINGKVALEVTANRLSNDYLLNAQPVTAISYSSKGRMKYSTRGDNVSFDVQGDLSLVASRLIGPDGTSSHVFSLMKISCRTKWKPSTRLRTTLDCMISRPSGQRSFLVAEWDASYRVSKTMTLFANVHNVMNVRMIRIRGQTAVSSYASGYNLIGRYLLLKASIDF